MPWFTSRSLISIMGFKPLLTAAIPLVMNLFLSAFFRGVTQLWLQPGSGQDFPFSLKGTFLKPVSILGVKGDGLTELREDGVGLGAGGKGAPPRHPPCGRKGGG